MEHFGILGLLPFIVGIGLLLWQKDILLPIIGCLILGSILLARLNPLLGFFTTAGETVAGSLLNSSSILTLAIIAESLIFFALLNRSGFIAVFVKELVKRKLERDLLEIIVFSAGILLFVHRHLASLLTGIFTRPFAEKKGLSPLRQAYIINTASSSVATLLPLTTLTPLILGAIGTTFQSLGIQFSPLRAFFQSLPYQFFNIFALFTVLSLMVLKKELPFNVYCSTLQKDRVLSIGLPLDTTKKPEGRTAIYGIASSLAVVFGSITSGLLFMKISTGMRAVGNLQHMQIVFINALFSGIIFTLLYSTVTRAVQYTELKVNPDGVFSQLIPLFLYIVLSMSAEILAKKLEIHTGLFGGLIGRPLSIRAIPLVVFLLSSIISFLSGSAPLTVIAVLPLAMKIASTLMTDPLLINNWIFASIAAVLSGAAFGDMNSPLSVNFILSTASTNAPLTGHFVTQGFTSLIAYSTSILFGYLLLMLNVKPYLSISAGFIAIALFLLFIVKDKS